MMKVSVMLLMLAATPALASESPSDWLHCTSPDLAIGTVTISGLSSSESGSESVDVRVNSLSGEVLDIYRAQVAPEQSAELRVAREVELRASFAGEHRGAAPDDAIISLRREDSHYKGIIVERGQISVLDCR